MSTSVFVTAKQLLEKAAKGIEKREVECSFGKVQVKDLTGAESILVSKGATSVDSRGNETVDPGRATKLMMQYGMVSPKLEPNQIDEFINIGSNTDITEIVKSITRQNTAPTDAPSPEVIEAAFPVE